MICAARFDDAQFDLIFLDPPYGKGWPAALPALRDHLTDNAIVVIEEAKRSVVTVSESYREAERRAKGDTQLIFSTPRDSVTLKRPTVALAEGGLRQQSCRPYTAPARSAYSQPISSGFTRSSIAAAWAFDAVLSRTRPTMPCNMPPAGTYYTQYRNPYSQCYRAALLHNKDGYILPHREY